MFVRELVAISACLEAVRWAARYKTAEAAWRACKDVRWMLFLISEMKIVERLKPFVDAKILALYSQHGSHAIERLRVYYRNDEYDSVIYSLLNNGYVVTADEIRAVIPKPPRLTKERLRVLQKERKDEDN
jgi:hypothetical protein